MGDDEKMHNFVCELITKTMTSKILKIVEELKEYENGHEMFPVCAGSLDNPETDSHRKPALEFIKTVCHVLSLDTTVEDEIQRMRRALLAQVGHREFSKDATFESPGQSFVLEDLICNHCNSC